MADSDPRELLLGLDGAVFEDEILEYLCSVLEEMEVEERQNQDTLEEVIAPFLVDSGTHSEDEAADICKSLATSFGGSGFKVIKVDDVDEPLLLSAPVKLADTEEVRQLNKKQTYGGALVKGRDNESVFEVNSDLESMQMPSTKSAMRKQRKQSEALARTLRMEAERRAEQAAEMMQARMAAIKASRASGGKHKTGVNVEELCLPHPSGSGELLSDAKLALSPGRRYGLVGKNGSGKSTLLRSLAHYKIPGLSHLKILLVDQHVEGDQYSALDWLLAADVERASLVEDEARLSMYIQREQELEGGKKLQLPPDLRGVNLEKALAETQDRMELIGVRTATQRAQKILMGLGFDQDMMLRPTLGLSGGWAMRAALAAALFVSPNLLLLDEPTNHLDLHALVWLEDWLLNFSGMVIIVSHDMYFLDSVCTDVLELKTILGGSTSSSLTHYNGDYRTYQRTQKEQRLASSRRREAFEKERDKLKEFIAREGKKFDTPQHQAQRKMKMKQLQQLEASAEAELDEESELVMSLPSPFGIFDKNEKLISIQNVSFAWPVAGQDVEDDEEGRETGIPSRPIEYQEPLFEGVDFVIQPRSRLAVLGRNGCGKTSFLNLLLDLADPTRGKVVKHPGCRITMLQQHHYKGEQLDPELTPLEHIRSMPQDDSTAVGKHDVGTRQEESATRGYLANFGVKRAQAVLPVKYLSGGQRMRVALAVALYTRPDLLVLDEPTNHLDEDTVRALCEALETFRGAIIAVSHDEAFINRVIASAGTTEGAGPGRESSDKKKDNGSATELGGEILVLARRKLQRFDGPFREYKKMIRTQVMSGKNHNDL